jgi:hypothetical protein
MRTLDACLQCMQCMQRYGIYISGYSYRIDTHKPTYLLLVLKRFIQPRCTRNDAPFLFQKGTAAETGWLPPYGITFDYYYYFATSKIIGKTFPRLRITAIDAMDHRSSETTGGVVL